MRVSIEVLSKASADGMKRRLRGLVPLGCLLLTACMGETTAIARQDVESNAKLATVAAAVPQEVQSQPAVQLARSAQSPNQATQDLSDIVSEGRLLLAEKSSKADVKKSKKAPPAKRLDSSKEEDAEEDDGDEDENAEEADSPKGGAGMSSTLKSIQSDFEPALRADLIEATVRGSVLTVVVSLTLRGNKDLSELVVKELGYCGGSYTWVTDYETGKTFRCMTTSGFKDGEIKSGETKNLRLTFEVPKESKNIKAVGITLYHLGTFDDVKLGSSGGSLSSKPRGSSKTEDIEEEDEEGGDDVDEEDSKGLTGKKAAKKGAKKGAK